VKDDDRIAKLQALLARVRSRSRAPRTPGGPYPPRAPVRPGPLEIATPMAAFRPSPLPPPEALATTSPPQPEPLPLPIALPLPPIQTTYATRPEVPSGLFVTPQPHPSGVRAVEPPPMEVIELEIDPDPSMPPPPVSGPRDDHDASLDDFSSAPGERPSGPLLAETRFESRSRLVSALPAALAAFEPLEAPQPLDSLDSLDPLDQLDPALDPPGHVPSDPTIEVAAAEVSRAELDALEAEHAPSSSRRPISMDEKMSELDDDVPLYNAPPESGRLPAVSPTFDLTFVEPTFAEATEPGATSAIRAERPAVTRVPGLPGTTESDVAVFVGAAPSGATPTTFGELLDDALSI
jgi:hypothetical protein